LRSEAGISEQNALQHAISSNCACCARLWLNVGAVTLRAGSLMEAERASRTAFRLGLKSATVRRVLADALDAQGRNRSADDMLIGLAASADAGDSAAEFLGLFIRFVSRGLSKKARACFRAAVSRAQEAAGPKTVQHIHRLQRELWSSATSSGKKRLVMGCLIQGNTPDGTWGPSWIDRGIGGSEQAAIYLASALERAGWQVEIYGTDHAAVSFSTAGLLSSAGALSADLCLGVASGYGNWFTPTLTLLRRVCPPPHAHALPARADASSCVASSCVASSCAASSCAACSCAALRASWPRRRGVR